MSILSRERTDEIVSSAEAGVATPVNDKVTEIIRGIQDGEYPLSFDNLDMIEVRPLQEIV